MGLKTYNQRTFKKMTTDQVTLNQTALNQILGLKITPLKIDGDYGDLTKSAVNIFINEIKKIYNNKKYNISLQGLHAIRMNDVYTNTFSDWFFVFDNNELKFFPASTKPGTTAVWKKGVEWIMGKQGVAVLKEGQIVDFWSINSAWWSGLPFLMQRLNCIIFRDKNQDNIISREIEHFGMFGINGHSWAGWRALVVSYWSDFTRKIGVALSEGCQVTVEQYWSILFPIIKNNNPNGLVDYTLIHLNDFK